MPVADYHMVEGEWVFGQIRERLPLALRPLWRHGLTILFIAVGLSLILFDIDSATDFARAFAVGTAFYIVPLAAQICRTNWYYRQAVGAAGTLPAHIACLAVGVTLYNLAFGIGFTLSLIDKLPTTASPTPFIVCFANLFVVAGLNFIWRYVLLRRNQEEGAGYGRA